MPPVLSIRSRSPTETESSQEKKEGWGDECKSKTTDKDTPDVSQQFHLFPQQVHIFCVTLQDKFCI